MAKVPVLMIVALPMMAGVAHAEVTVTPAFVTDYDFRGITRTRKDPAAQLGVDYTFSSGFYTSAWGSNVDFGPGDPDLELDVGGGFRMGDADTAYDLGLVGRIFPGASGINTLEAYAGITRGMLGGKLWVSPDYNGSGRSAWYLEGNVQVPLAARLSFAGHMGWSDGRAWRSIDGYYDWSMGVVWSGRSLTLGLKYVDGEHPVVDGRLVGSVSVKLPWSAQ